MGTIIAVILIAISAITFVAGYRYSTKAQKAYDKEFDKWNRVKHDYYDRFSPKNQLIDEYRSISSTLNMTSYCFALFAGALLFICATSYGIYINDLNSYKNYDKKIAQINSNSDVLVDESKKVLLQYPELEKSLLKELKPETMIALGQTYPNLKSNESYTQIAALLKERMSEKEKLQTEKIDKEIALDNAKAWWWFASNWKEDAK